MVYAIEDVCEEFNNSTDLAAMKNIVDMQVKRLGFDRFAYHLMRPPEGPRIPLALATYPVEWTRRYTERNYVNIDPVVSAAVSRLLPFQWHRLTSGRHSTSRQREILIEARDFKLRNGITVPIHGPGQGLATLNVTSDSSKVEAAKLWTKHQINLLLLAFFMHEAVVKKTTKNSPTPIFHLAPRERECLMWTAQGKTAWEISEILNLSSSTVVGYLKSAISKLGVYSKTHAVAKAILLGLITP